MHEKGYSNEKQPLIDVLQNRCSKNFRNIHRKTPVLESHFNKLAGLQLHQKESLTQVLYCEYCEIFKKSFFIELLLRKDATFRHYEHAEFSVISKNR